MKMFIIFELLFVICELTIYFEVRFLLLYK